MHVCVYTRVRAHAKSRCSIEVFNASFSPPSPCNPHRYAAVAIFLLSFYGLSGMLFVFYCERPSAPF